MTSLAQAQQAYDDKLPDDYWAPPEDSPEEAARQAFDDTDRDMRAWLNDDDAFGHIRSVIYAAIAWDGSGHEQRTLDLRAAIDRMREAYVARVMGAV